MAETRVLVIADHLLARLGLAALVATQPELIVVGQSPGGTHLLADVEVYRPEVAVYDLGHDPAPLLPHMAALAEARLPLIALLPDAESASAVAALMGESSPYALLLRDTDASTLAAAAYAVAAGLVVLDPALTNVLRPPTEAPLPMTDELTQREFEVLQLLAEGLTNKAIAQRLGISANTVKFHINAILQKLDAQSRTEAVVRASRLGLIIL